MIKMTLEEKLKEYRNKQICEINSANEVIDKIKSEIETYFGNIVCPDCKVKMNLVFDLECLISNLTKLSEGYFLICKTCDLKIRICKRYNHEWDIDSIKGYSLNNTVSKILTSKKEFKLVE